MRTTFKTFALLIAMTFIGAVAANAQKTTDSKTKKPAEMKTYVIERDMPGVGSLNAAQLRSASQNSCAVITDLGPKIEWVHSYVTGDKIYCIYKAESEEIIREHAQKTGLPANKISELATIISPETAK